MRTVDIRRLGCGTPKPYKHETGRACRTLAGLVTHSCHHRVARTIPGLGLNPKPVTRCSDTPRDPGQQPRALARQRGESTDKNARPALYLNTCPAGPILAARPINKRTARRPTSPISDAARGNNYRPVGERVIPVACRAMASVRPQTGRHPSSVLRSRRALLCSHRSPAGIIPPHARRQR